MTRQNFTQYDEYPEGMLVYLRNYGPHFNKKLCQFAVKQMKGRFPVETLDKEELDNILRQNKVEIENGQLYDAVYVANMCRNDFYGSSIGDDRQMSLYVKDVIDDIDGADGLVFNRWYADMSYLGIAIDWEDML